MNSGSRCYFISRAHLLHMRVRLCRRFRLHPIAVAAWVGMFATSLNLLPGGQLDGGHILYLGLAAPASLVHDSTVFALVPLGKYFWTGWFLWAVMLGVDVEASAGSALSHGDWRPTRHCRVWRMLMLVLSFTPAPLTHSSGKEQLWPDIRDGETTITAQ